MVGIFALIFLGPRRLPEMARKLGKMMAEFRGTANEFKETWQREINIEEESKALDVNALEIETVSRSGHDEPAKVPNKPMIKEVDPARFEHLAGADLQNPDHVQGLDTQPERQQTLPLDSTEADDKKDRL